MTGHRFGAAHDPLVVEERLTGTELSLGVRSDGVRFQALPTTQDDKRLLDGDRGSNTGGMGAVAPHPEASPELMSEVSEEIVGPVLEELAREGRPFRSVRYAGLMLTDDGPNALEGNARLGDPEPGVVLPLPTDDLYSYVLGIAEGKRPDIPPRFAGASVAVVMAAVGSPERAEKGIPIHLPSRPESLIFQAPTERGDGPLTSGGGRTLLVVGQRDPLKAARATASRDVEQVTVPGAQFRRDLGGGQ